MMTEYGDQDITVDDLLEEQEEKVNNLFKECSNLANCLVVGNGNSIPGSIRMRYLPGRSKSFSFEATAEDLPSNYSFYGGNYREALQGLKDLLKTECEGKLLRITTILGKSNGVSIADELNSNLPRFRSPVITDKMLWLGHHLRFDLYEVNGIVYTIYGNRDGDYNSYSVEKLSSWKNYDERPANSVTFSYSEWNALREALFRFENRKK